MITEKEIEMLKQIEAQANPNPWTDFAGNGRSHRTHIGYQANTIDEGGNPVNIALFETNTNAKRADVLLAVYARNYLVPLLNELVKLRADNAILADMYDEAVRSRIEKVTP